MIDVISVNIDSKGRVKTSSKVLCNQYETGVAKFDIDVPSDWQDDSYYYYLGVVPPSSTGLKQYVVPLTRFEFQITSGITWHLGTWYFVFMVLNTELPNTGDIPQENIVSISNAWEGYVNKSVLKPSDLEQQPVDPNFELLYSDLMALSARVEVKGNYAEAQGDYAKGVGEQLLQDKTDGVFDGADGQDGADGVSPTVTVATNTDTEYTLNITDVNGTITTPNLIGPQGATGADGSDGFSPTIEVNTSTSSEYTLDITDASGTTTTPNLKGADGSDGNDGVSPTVAVNTSTSSTYTLDITDVNGTITTPNLRGADGSDGQDGADGTSPTIAVNTSTSTEYTLSITDKNGTIITPNLKGQDGSAGTLDYTDLSNKPSINGVTLTGNKSLSDLGIAAANSVINATDLTVTSNATNLVGYVSTPGIYKVPSNCYIYTDSTSSTANRIYAQTGDIVQIEPQIEVDDGENNISYITYFTVYGAQIYRGAMTTTDNSTWTSSIVFYESQSNKVTTIASNSSDLRYPSAQAVYTFVNNNYASKSKYGDSTINTGRSANTTVGTASAALGQYNTASARDAFAIGISNTASGSDSVVSGEECTASGETAMAGGIGSVASGDESLAFGDYVTASGNVSVALGEQTLAQSDNQFAIGKYNVGDSNDTYAEILGNGRWVVGTGAVRSNARTTDWSGNGWYAGNVKVGGTSYSDSNAKELATKEYINSLVVDGAKKTMLYNGKANNTAILSDNIQELSDSIFNYDLIIVGFNCLVGGSRVMELTMPVYPKSSLIVFCDSTGTGATGAYHIVNANTAFASGNAYRVMWGFTDATHIRNIISNQVGWGSPGICYVIGYKFSVLPEGYMQEPTTEGTNGQALTTDGNGGRTWTTISAGIGQDLTGQTVYPEDGWQTTAGTNAEIFNDYRTRAYTDSVPTAGNVASGNYSHAEGSCTTASANYSHAEGLNSYANGTGTHAEGYNTFASGNGSHAEGGGSSSDGDYSHAEGGGSSSSGAYSHAEGYATTASGANAHAEGYYTTAQRKSQHVQGEYNVLDTSGTATTRGTYADIVGNGTGTSARSNAYTLDWSGNGWFAGDVYTGSTSGTNKDAGSKKLATEDYVDNKITYGTTELTDGVSSLASGTLYFQYE